MPNPTASRNFHVLPQLFVGLDEPAPNRKNINVRVTSEALGNIFEPTGGALVRQPLPNKCYFVGGSKDNRYGWMVPLPEQINQFDLVIEWSITRGKGEDATIYTIRHILLIQLLPSKFDTYSMDVSCWHRVKSFSEDSPPMNYQPYARLFGDEFQQERNVRVQYDETTPAIMEYRESFEVPGIPASDLWSIKEFSETQLHEIKHKATFQSNNDLHIANACIELPADKFHQAVLLARSIQYDGEGSEFKGHGQCEQHPALRLLCDWWNEYAPTPETRCAGFAMPWVRVDDDGYYWCSYCETPNSQIKDFMSDAQGNARIGDLILIEFMKGAKDFIYSSKGLQTYHVTGNEAWTIGVSEKEVVSGDYDEAWYALEALAAFPDRFPEAWRVILSLTVVPAMSGGGQI